MAYIGNELNTVFTVGKLCSIHYFEYMSTFAFEGESRFLGVRIRRQG